MAAVVHGIESSPIVGVINGVHLFPQLFPQLDSPKAFVDLAV
jgi:hypothetical protein